MRWLCSLKPKTPSHSSSLDFIIEAQDLDEAALFYARKLLSYDLNIAMTEGPLLTMEIRELSTENPASENSPSESSPWMTKYVQIL